jgi:hypothetical protein
MEKSVKIEPKLKEKTKESLSLNPQEPYRLAKSICFKIDSESAVTLPPNQAAETHQACITGIATTILSMQRQLTFR